MTNMLEKPRSKRAKSFDHPHTQDHGTKGTDRRRIALKKAMERVRPDSTEHDPVKRQKLYNFDRFLARFDAGRELDEPSRVQRRKAALGELAAAQEVVTGLYDHMTPDELEEEADLLLQEADNGEVKAPAESMPPTIIEAGGRTGKEIRASMARAATLDTFEDDDFGDYDGGSHVRISNRPR